MKPWFPNPEAIFAFGSTELLMGTVLGFAGLKRQGPQALGGRAGGRYVMGPVPKSRPPVNRLRSWNPFTTSLEYVLTA